MNADVPKMIQFGVVAKKLQQNTATKKNMAMEHPNTLLDLGKVLDTGTPPLTRFSYTAVFYLTLFFLGQKPC